MDVEGISGVLIAILAVLAVAVYLLMNVRSKFVRVLREDQRGVVFRLGRFEGVRGPGLVLLMPLIDRMVVVSLKSTKLELPPFEIKSWDGHNSVVKATINYHVIDPEKAILESENFKKRMAILAREHLEAKLSNADTYHLRAGQKLLSVELKEALCREMGDVGVMVEGVEIGTQ